MTSKEWNKRLRNIYDYCAFKKTNRVKVEFTVAELRDLTMKMNKLKQYEEQFEKDRDVEC